MVAMAGVAAVVATLVVQTPVAGMPAALMAATVVMPLLAVL
jgi:hypothetical protein